MRQETVLDVLVHLAKNGGDYQEQFAKEVTNTVVLTGYNNATYSIVDVNWTMNPMTTFKGRDGDQTFVDYYKKRYNLQIRDTRQPLLVTRLSPRDIRGGRTEPALLVPELCRTTGLTDNMHSNFQMMKALSEFTKMSPNHRHKGLMGFSKRLRETQESYDTMYKFGIKMEPTLQYAMGRMLVPEAIYFGNNRQEKPDAKTADWTPALRNNIQYANEELKKWVIIFPRKVLGDTDVFLNMMKEVSHGLKFTMADPKRVELSDDRSSSYARELLEYCKKDPKLIMVVFMGKQNLLNKKNLN